MTWNQRSIQLIKRSLIISYLQKWWDKDFEFIRFSNHDIQVILDYRDPRKKTDSESALSETALWPRKLHVFGINLCNNQRNTVLPKSRYVLLQKIFKLSSHGMKSVCKFETFFVFLICYFDHNISGIREWMGNKRKIQKFFWTKSNSKTEWSKENK